MSQFAGVLGEHPSEAIATEIRAALEVGAPHGTTELRLPGALFLHAHLDTGRASHAPSLTAFDALVFIGDVRLDTPEELRARLDVAACDEATLVLHAFRRWGAACVEELVGDFAFAIYDRGARTLFCARDPFGVRPFYYAREGSRFVFSSSLRGVLAVLSNRALDDTAIEDFLLFSLTMDPQRTTYAQVRTLPAAHCMDVHDGHASLRRWWTLPIEEPLQFRDEAELMDAFNEQLNRAVRARITERVAVSMSGGLDSTSIATVAAESGASVFAQTILFDPLVPDDEERFARAAAARIGAEHELIDASDHSLFAHWDEPGFAKAEPTSDPLSAITTAQYRRASERTTVMLGGQGGDVVFYTTHPYLFNFLRRGRVDRVAYEVLSFLVQRGRMPPLCLRSSFRRWRGVRPAHPALPPWIRNRALESRWNAEWDDLPEVHPWRPQAYALLDRVSWPRLFEYSDGAAMGAPIEYRNPYFDLQLVRFLLRVPAMPWFAEKELLRVAMRGRLPESVRTRRKVPIGMDPAHVWLSRQRDAMCDVLTRSPLIERWIDASQACMAISSEARTLYDSFLLCLPLSLAKWLGSGIRPAIAG